MKKTRIVAILLLIVTALTAFPACGECEHTFDGGVCTKCGDTDPDFIPICAHEYKDGTCTKCGVTCAHTYENGVCTVCGKGCAHSYTDGVCTVCGKNCAHSYTDGVCTVCGKNCSHSYTDGVCTVCGKNCAHSYTDGVCTVCGKGCAHSYTDGVCTVCGKNCSHIYTDGVCTVCGKNCSHIYTDGVCTVCGKGCAHSYTDGVCTVCGKGCAHSYTDGVCTVCGKNCSHSYTDGVCTVCGKNCSHSYTDGVCTVCGKNCSHSYTDGVCTVCGKNCAHSYTDGVCTVCGKNCSHSYTDGVCTVCGKGCAHSYTDGVCTVCGMKKPTVIPEDGGASVYAPIISRFKELILYKNTYTELPPKGDSEPEYVDALYEVGAEYSPEKDMGYALRDINGDGLLELVLMERDCHVHALFTIVDGAPVTVKVFQQGMGYLLPNYIGNYKSNDIGYNNHCGTVFYNEKDWDSDGQILMINRIMTLTSDGRLVGIGYGWRDGDGAFSTENDTVYFRINDGVTTDIEKTEYDGIAANYEYFWSYPSRLTRWVGLYFEPALPAQILDIPTADFSTYDGIIKTFGDMFFEVAYNPLKGKSQFDKSKWTGGTYETLMRFKSAEDYYIFNRLVGACVTVQSSSSAKFGYALKDIDGNGSEELILMESKGYILAIFTLKDGKAVLLDTYSDLKSIWVDAGGLLHVQERALPGNKGDTLYTVYALKDGELVPTLSVGYLCKKDGYKNTPYLWFVIEDGKTVQKSQGDWDVNYYAKWLGDIGTGKYYEYNLKNAGITFTELTDDSE